MNVFIYSHREDERLFFKNFCEKNHISYRFTSEGPSIENINTLENISCVSIVTTPINREFLDAFKKVGVSYISTRSMGTDHIDVAYANEIGITIGNVSYEPNIVAEYAVMMMLMASRHIKTILSRFQVQDFSLIGVRGRLLKNLTIGVVGTGRIGQQVISYLRPFGCEIICYDLYEQENIKDFATYVSFDTLLKRSDLVTLHLPSTDENMHMINRDAIAKMKTGAVIVNTGRGPLIDTMAIVEGLESKKLGGVALDVIEDESYLYYRDLKAEALTNRPLNLLRSFPNAILTPHTAFYTEEAVRQMAENSIAGCIEYMKTTGKS
jgi:D-lactate dehydrogenase